MTSERGRERDLDLFFGAYQERINTAKRLHPHPRLRGVPRRPSLSPYSTPCAKDAARKTDLRYTTVRRRKEKKISFSAAMRPCLMETERRGFRERYLYARCVVYEIPCRYRGEELINVARFVGLFANERTQMLARRV